MTAALPLQQKFIHGQGMTPYGIFLLADAYRRAGDAVGRDPLASRFSENPRRLLYLEAIENYLRAHLRHAGETPSQIRAYNHNFLSMARSCSATGMVMSTKTLAFLEAASQEGDYVRVRYDFDMRHLGETWPPPHRPNASMKVLLAAVEELHSLAATVTEPEAPSPPP